MSLYSGKQQSRRGYQGSIGSFIGGLAKRALGLSPIGKAAAVIKVGGALIQNRQQIAAIPPRIQGMFPSIPIPGGFSDVSGGGSTAYKGGGMVRYRADGKPYKRPRMNAANPRALKRAIRRVVRFGQLARSVGYGRPPKAVKNVKAGRKGR